MEEAQKPWDKDCPSRHLSILGVLGDELPLAKKVSGDAPRRSNWDIIIILLISHASLHHADKQQHKSPP